MHYKAWLALSAGELRDCLLSDISDTGARIKVDDAETLPDRFFLLLSNRGGARRVCRVIWRKSSQIGVHFERSYTGEPDPGEPS